MCDVILDELLVFSDHHAFAHQYGSKEVVYRGDVYNSRLVAACEVISQMDTYARENSIRTVCFGGDLFHTRDAVTTDALFSTLTSIKELAVGKRVFLLTGNHDYFDRVGRIHSLEPFKYLPNVKVIDWTSELSHTLHGKRKDQYTLQFVPFTEEKGLAHKTIDDLSKIKTEGPKVLFAHLGMQGARVGSDYVLVADSDISVGDIPSDAYAGCFFGHFHEHQQVFKNGWFIGATSQHNWGDANTKRGFLHVRVFIDYVDFKFIESDSPRFHLLNEGDLETAQIRKQDFVKVLTDTKLDEKEHARIKDKVGSNHCEVIYVPEDIKIRTMEINDHNLSPNIMVERWVEANQDWLKTHLPDVARDELVVYGKKILDL